MCFRRKSPDARLILADAVNNFFIVVKEASAIKWMPNLLALRILWNAQRKLLDIEKPKKSNVTKKCAIEFAWQ